jgi:hypothetical protein
VEASLARKKKKAKKAKRRQEKEMEIVHPFWMGEDRDIIQEEYELELWIDSNDGDCSEEEELESGDADSFIVKPLTTAGSEIPEGSRMSASTLEARKCIVEDDVAPTDGAK